MHDKVSVVDRFSFLYSSRNSFQEAKSIVMQTSIVSNQISGGGEQSLREGTEESQTSDSIM